MRIYSMTATFGKLEHQTLTLQPGLNIIEAPNEWGKSTWCAFLVAMLYGIDTRTHSTKNTLADKDRYTPWSGSPMSGSMDLNWDGRDITIQRSTKGRIPMGEFSAFETESGIPVEELTAENCGQMLLGVEKTVFTRSGFIKLTDLPVTQDEALLRRLNALVTTGDDSGTAEALEQQLKDMKNRCRYNKSGLIPQAQAEADALGETLDTLDSLKQQFETCRKQHKEVLDRINKLENHRTALRYHDAQADAMRVASAVSDREEAAKQLESLEADCAQLPPREQANRALLKLQELQEEKAALEKQLGAQPPEEHPVFGKMPPEEALATARQDTEAFVQAGILSPLPLILGAVAGLLGIVLAVIIPKQWYIGAGLLLVGVLLLTVYILNGKKKKAIRTSLAARYDAPPETWIPMAKEYAGVDGEDFSELKERMDELQEEIDTLCEGESMTDLMEQCRQIMAKHDAYAAAQRDYQRYASHAATIEAMATPADAPEFDDELTCTEAETAQLLEAAIDELRQIQMRMGQAQGQMEALGNEHELRSRFDAAQERLSKLENTYAAVSIALEALSEAKTELQRRFAPRLAKRAQGLFAAMTGNRYDRLTLDQDLGLQAGAENEDILRSALWRSDGTADQLYLALRLAVSAELTPKAPLILDDALVRFDDVRLKAAIEILKEESKQKQVILFTCQSREAKI